MAPTRLGLTDTILRRSILFVAATPRIAIMASVVHVDDLEGDPPALPEGGITTAQHATNMTPATARMTLHIGGTVILDLTDLVAERLSDPSMLPRRR